MAFESTHMKSSSLRPVFFLAFATDFNLLNIPVEAQLIKDVLKEAERELLCEVVLKPVKTADDIFEVFNDSVYSGRIAVFHYAGHANAYQLLLDSANDHSDVAGAGGLAAFFALQQGLHLVFLNGCSTRAHVQGLLEAKVAVVLATTQGIADRMAAEFAHNFYLLLAKKKTIAYAYDATKTMIRTKYDSPERGLILPNALKGQPAGERTQDLLPWEMRVASDDASAWSLPKALRTMCLKHMLTTQCKGVSAATTIHECSVASPLIPEWNKFLKSRRWVDTVQSWLADGDFHPNFRQAIDDLKSIDWTSDYSTIWESLSIQARKIRLKAQALLDTLHTKLKLRNHHESTDDTSNDLKHELTMAFFVRDLADKLIERPHFARCFLTLGSFGSGKSHFVAHVIRDAHSNNVVTIPLIVDDAITDFDQWLLQRIQTLTGVDYESVEDLNRLLHDCDLRMVCIVEDLHRFFLSTKNVLDEFTGWIRRSTRFGCLSWLITAQDTMFDQILYQQPFWSDHSATDNTLGGWRLLDSLNVAHEIGVKILQEHVSTLVELQQLELNAPLKRQLLSPLMAWLYIDYLSEQGNVPLGSLNTAGFCLLQWDKIFAKRIDTTFTKVELIAACKAIAQQIFDMKTLCPNAQPLLSDREWRNSPFGSLEKMGLIVRITANDLVDTDSRIELRFENLWYQWIASVAKSGVGSQQNPLTRERIAAWFAEFDVDYACEGVWEFLLLGSGNKALIGILPKLLESEAWAWAFEEPSIPGAAVFFASTQATVVEREMVLGKVLELRPSLSERELFALMYFLAAADDICPVQRLSALQDFHRQLAGTVLSSYYYHVVTRVIDSLGNLQDWIEGMHELIGCVRLNQVMENDLDSPIMAQEIANYAFNWLINYLGEDDAETITLTVLEYLNGEFGNGLGNDQEIAVPRNFSRSWFLHTCLEQLLCEFLLNGSSPKDVFLFLYRLGWYDQSSDSTAVDYRSSSNDFHDKVMRSKHRQANLVFAHWFREVSRRLVKDDSASSEYVSLCEDLFSLKIDDLSLPTYCKEISFFMVYHTIPRQERKYSSGTTRPQWIDRQFRPLVEKMRLNASQDEAFKRVFKPMDVQGDSDAPLS